MQRSTQRKRNDYPTSLRTGSRPLFSDHQFGHEIFKLNFDHFFFEKSKLKKMVLENCLKFLIMKFVDFFNNPYEATSVHKFKIRKNDGFFIFSRSN